MKTIVNSEKIRDIITRMTLEEKAGLCSGKDFWNLKGLEKHGIPSIMVTDGPHGLRKQGSESDHIGLNASIPSTCFPTASAIASSWDISLIKEVGIALGEECRQEKVAVLLGPGVNIKRSPLCGRNFEYFSEDPFLSGKMAAGFIDGVQSQGIGTSLKHFAANNQEKRRMTIDAVIDDRALREIYLAGFEEAVKAAQPKTVMCAYNRLNGEYCSENSLLLTKILKEEWGHEGIVVTDWGAANDRVKGLEAGLELEMPGNGGMNDKKIVEAVKTGSLSESVLDKSVERIVKVILETSSALDDEYKYDVEKHHKLAQRTAESSAVLLKNEGILPLEIGKSVAVIGKFAKEPRYQGSGSSLINPIKLDNFMDPMQKMLAGSSHIMYAEGYDLNSEVVDSTLITQAIEAAKSCDIAVVFAGLPEMAESEGFDRLHLDMPKNHNALIEAVSEVNPNTVVVLSNGAPVAMPWLGQVKGVLESYLGGQAWGSAIVNLLYGKAVPSGKLAETFPLSLSDDPANSNFPGGSSAVAYAESIYVGYRYYDSAKKQVLFPFGFGLSYTTFEYSGCSVEYMDVEDKVKVSFTIKNTGKMDGEEISQVYVHDIVSTVFRPEKELKGFTKTFIEAGKEKRITLELDRRSFAFRDTGKDSWIVEEGSFEILIGSSSADIRLNKEISLSSKDTLSEWALGLKELVPEYYGIDQKIFSDLSQSGPFRRLMDRELPLMDIPSGAAYTRTSSIDDVRKTLIGKLLYRVMLMGIKKMVGKDADPRTMRMMEAIVKEMPLRSMGMMSEGKFSIEMIDAVVLMINGHFFKGLGKIIKTPAKGKD